MNDLRNRVQLIGHLGADPELKKFESGAAITTFRMATNENYKNKEGEWVTDTQWHNIVAWSPFAEVLKKKLAKGKEVAVVGKLVNRTYDDSNGEKKYFTEIRLSNYELFDKPSGDSNGKEEEKKKVSK